jgi:GNAT superfamily N-acetyltransferase
MDFIIRKGIIADIPALLNLIKELADYEKAPQEVITTESQMLADGFGENPLYQFLVAEHKNTLVGFALTYYRYSTWKGKVLYLEDLYIQPEFRRFGLGQLFWKELLAKAKQEKCQRMSWQVLDWNEPAVKFYQKLGANIDKGWWNGFVEI